ncbi:MAG TPA: phosphoadenosine phosphosulfate reductase family protein, partial [Methanomassiliicoccales archaeon]|nr:phosphoadenosine phosphosulfate reductase family protein [Methanomassiliicoccales archaeon]
PGSQIMEMNGEFAAQDPLIALAGKLVCAASARAPSSEAKIAEKAIHIRGAGNADGAWEAKKSDERVFVEGNADHLARLESKGVSDIKSFAKQGKAPLTVSFSGGKDSLAAYSLAKKAMKEVTLIFVNTGLEFPETVEYVKRFAAKHGDRQMVADAGNAFWENVEAFGPPAKDFRWCCKVCKLAPLTDLIERTYPEGTTTVEGNRQLESFAREDIRFVEKNPFVPNQTVLNPIREWRAADVWAYIWWKGLEYNPLYEEDFERIGCYLCPSCLASEWKRTESIHPDLYRMWTEHLNRWARAGGVSPDFIRFGFWRWKVLPAKMRLLSEQIKLQVPKQRSDRLRLKMVKGLSACLTGGYSIEGVISVPCRRPFSRVGEVLKTVGKTKVSEEYEIALTKGKESTVKAFGGGQVVATGSTPEKAKEAFEAGVKAFLRAEMCTMCGICVKNCKRKAIRLDQGPVVDEELCVQCGKCSEACVVAHYYDKLVAEG